MVQRKVPSSKLGIQADHVKTEKRFGNLKPSSCQSQDGKNRGSDMKKKMKRSRSIKLSAIESLNSSPAKLPPLSPSIIAATPHKQPMIKTTGSSPNYMKATSSSEARKDRSYNTPTPSDSKNLRRRNSSNSKLSSSFSDTPIRSLTRSSSLKRVRTLTKSPSFKPVRCATKRCSRVALCADIDVQKATCSSTLKDSKFPAYLMLNPGGTDAEGTSILKVCPYTYCSLNGHHHEPAPPLKSFLKAKRRSMKAQKNAKPVVPSPFRAKPSTDGTEKTGNEVLIFSGEKSPQYEADFFIEIYATSIDDGAEATESLADDGNGTIDFAGEHSDSSSMHSSDAAAEQDNMQQDAEEVTDTSLQMDTDYASTEEGDNILEASDMEWEEGQRSISEIYNEVEHLNKPEKDFCIIGDYLSESKELDYPNEPEIIISDDRISNYTEETLADEVLQELFEQETASFDSQSRHSDPELEGILDEKREDADQDIMVNDNQNPITAEAFQFDTISEINSLSQELADEIVENHILLEKDQDGTNKLNTPNAMDSQEHSNSGICTISSAENDAAEVEKTEAEVDTEPDTAQSVLTADNGTSPGLGSRYQRQGRKSQELSSICNGKWTIQCEKPIMESDEERDFNPREPNFLPVIPDPDAEKVDLKHQIMDDRKNSEEWMVDYALRQAVTKLAPARKRKVALLVAAFETVLPVPKYETHRRNTSAVISHTRPMQACS
ncbi:uncharacterized protein LOC126682562 [Mercurialis annua]|uniref:uncharacterized protein LOC126682562 n=1 Tax=Mercurialis annua TaxID=3986 RepID=UPI00215E4246|nr:uncharacterized protein LOC126682562 [Mercurialis annua]